jgi:hypothetical protein
LGVPQTPPQFTALRFVIALALGRVVRCIFAKVVSIPPPPLQKMPLPPLTRLLVRLKICVYLRNLREKKIVNTTIITQIVRMFADLIEVKENLNGTSGTLAPATRK